MKRVIFAVIAVTLLLGFALAGYWLGSTRSGELGQPHFAVASSNPAATKPSHTIHESPKPSPETQGFAFTRLLIDSKGDNPEACLQFSAALAAEAETHYADYLRIDPAFSPALHATDKQLCMGGLGYGKDYKVTLLRGLPSAGGAHLADNLEVDVSLSDRAPLVAISGDGFILPRGTSNGLAVQTINVAKLKIHVLRMSDRLVPTRIAQGREASENNPLHTQAVEPYLVRELIQGMAGLVWSGTMDVPPDHNRTVQTAFPLDSVIPAGQHGAYLVIAENAATALPEAVYSAKHADGDEPEDAWSQLAAHWVISTDIALTTMSGQDGLHVFARSLATADPLSGVKLTLMSAGQDILAEGTSGGDGRIDFASGLLRGVGAGAPSSLVAYGGDGDFAVLDLDRPAFDFSDRGVSGRPAPQPIEAFLYADRGIYRPGETVNLMTLLRDRTGEAIDNMPVTLILRRPDGIESKRFVVSKLPAGGAAQPITLADTAARGLWTIDAMVDPTGTPVGHLQIDVQDFVPQQLKVTAKTDAAFVKPGEPVTVAVKADYLYGAPATGLKGEAEITLTRDPTPVAAAKDYQFGLVDQAQNDTVQQVDLPPVDDTGNTTLNVSLDAPEQQTGPLKAVIRTGVFEPGGRIVNDTIELPFRAAPVLVGIKPRFTDNRTDEGSTAVFDLRCFDETGEPLAVAGLHWQLIRENRAFDWFSEGNGWTWHYHVVDEPIAAGTVDATAEVPASVSAQVDWGDYRLVVTDPASNAQTSVHFDAGWGDTSETADTPDKIDVISDKPALGIGDTAHIRIKGPFAGKAQVTVAGDRIFESHAVDIPADGASVDVTATADWGPGAYVLVSLYRPMAEGRAHDPVRAVGLAWLGIDAAPRTLKVTVTAPEKIVPRQTVTIPVKLEHAQGGAYVTLAAVDEGILQLTRFQTPDPAAFLFGKRLLGIEMRDDYGRLLDGSAAAGAIQEGGDEGIGGPGLPVTTTRTVALFSGPVALDAGGNASIRLDIPDFEGQLRLMAIAYDPHGVGSGQATMIVRDPVIANLSLPRFLSPGDSAHAAIDLHNTDGSAGRYRLTLGTSGSVKLATPGKPLDYDLTAGQQKLDGVDLVATDAGIGTITADLTGPAGYKVHREWQIAIRSAHYPVSLVQTASQASGESFTLDGAVLKPFVPGSETVSLGYSAVAGIDVPSLLQSLYTYPFGCTEQLVSGAFALIYYSDPALLGSVKQDVGVHQRVQNAIDQILNRQDMSGEFGLWRVDDGEASTWLNVYAVDFLTRAKELGFDIPAPALRRSVQWVRDALARTEDAEAGAYAEAPDATRAYALYVLAREGRADIGELRRLADQIGHRHLAAARRNVAPVYWRPDDKGEDSLAEPLSLGHLAAALALMGDRPRANDALAAAVGNIGLKTFPLWWFYAAYYSEVRDLAGLIAIAAEMGDDKVTADLIGRLHDLSVPNDDLNTQDKAALLGAVHALNRADVSRVIRVNGTALAEPKLPLELAPDAKQIAAGFSVANGGDRPIWRTLTVNGAPAEALPALQRGYTLTRSYVDLTGKPIDPTHLRQNDRVIVVLDGRVDDPNDHRSIAIDLLPAGWEIEGIVHPAPPKSDSDNADTTKAPNVEYEFLQPLSKLQMAETRDDRLVAAFELGGRNEDPESAHEKNDKEKTLDRRAFKIAYVVRVVTPGQFDLPEGVVQDMYRPSMMGRTAAGHTQIDPR